MPVKTHKTAVVIIPPEEAWEPIQAIRQIHDRQVRRWMPHVTMLYPFRPADQLDAAGEVLAGACAGIEPFEVELAEFGFFSHGKRSYTMWLSPQPAERMTALHEALWRAAPDCDDVRKFAAGFRPHLSVGQTRDKHQLRELIASFQAGWQPLRFRVEAVNLIRREDPPDDVFRLVRAIPLGAARQGDPAR